jgi:hypothetical protein
MNRATVGVRGPIRVLLGAMNRSIALGNLGEDGPTMTTTLIALAAAALVVAGILPTGIG